jgi:Magnesium chelatase, subunit ChlI
LNEEGQTSLHLGIARQFVCPHAEHFANPTSITWSAGTAKPTGFSRAPKTPAISIRLGSVWSRRYGVWKPSASPSRHWVSNALMLGPPGAGNSMLGCRLTTSLPAITLAEALETTRLHRVAGLTGGRPALENKRPCHTADHISISDVAVPHPATSMRRFASHCSGLHTRSIFSNGM